MTKNLWLGLILVLALATTIFAQSSKITTTNNSEQNASPAKSVSNSVRSVYDYPLKPGIEEWKSLETHDEMLDATQMPAKYLKMPTVSLLENVLNYPLIMDAIVFNSKQQGFDALALNFNGLSELMSRKDVGAIVLSKYRTVDVNSVRSMVLEDQGNLSFMIEFLETLASQDAVLNSLSDNQKNELLEELLRKNDDKEKNSDVYGFSGKESTAFSIGRLLVKLDPNFAAISSSEQSLTDFIEDGSATTRANVDWIIEKAQDHSSGIMRGFLYRDTAAPSNTTTVRTPKDSNVTVLVISTDYTSAQRTACNNSISRDYPQAIRETNCTKKYNCHSYAWHSQSTSNNYWMDSPGDDTYWNDRSYVGSYAVGAANRKVSYANGDHSAITINGTEFRSKWGPGPRMRHRYNYSPYNSSAIYYYERGR